MSNAYNAFAKGVILLRATFFRVQYIFPISDEIDKFEVIKSFKTFFVHFIE